MLSLILLSVLVPLALSGDCTVDDGTCQLESVGLNGQVQIWRDTDSEDSTYINVYFMWGVTFPHTHAYIYIYVYIAKIG